MKAIIHDTYGSPDVLELRDVEMPVGRRRQRPGARPGGLRESPRLALPAWRAVRHAGPIRAARSQEDERGERRGGRRRGRRQGRVSLQARRRGVRRRQRKLRRVRGRPGRPPGIEACEPDLRAGRRRARGRVDGPAGAARQGRDPGGAASAHHRGGRRGRHVRRPDRQDVRRERDRRLQHAERGHGPVARRRPRRRLHERGLHEAGRDLRRDLPAGGDRLTAGVQARAHAQGDAAAEQRRVEWPLDRAARAGSSRRSSSRRSSASGWSRSSRSGARTTFGS